MNRMPVCVRDVMIKDPVTVTPDTEIRRVVLLLVENDISGAIVVGEGKRIVGVVTERDCIAVASEAGYYEDWGGPVSQFMSTTIETVTPGDNLVDVAARMARSPYRRYPVVDNGKLVGLLSRRDVLHVINSGSWSRPDPPKTSHP